MKYYLKPHVTAEMLEAVGFRLCEDTPSNIEDEDYIRDVNDDIQVYISLGFSGYNKQVLNAYGDNRLVEDYIQDLIDLDYVEVRND